MAMVEIKNLSKSFGANKVLDNISLSFEKGEVVSFIGPSGTGKSTLLRCINLLEIPDQGSVKIDDVIYNAGKKENVLALRRQSGMVFQHFNLFRNKTALENVMEALLVVKKMPKKEARERAWAALEKVGLPDKAGHYPVHLSGGQQQRVAIARSLALEPKLLMFDEPTSALDPELVGDVLDTILKAASEGWTMLLVSHEMDFVRHVSDRVLFLDGGNILEEGSASQVFNFPGHERVRDFIAKIERIKGPEYLI